MIIIYPWFLVFIMFILNRSCCWKHVGMISWSNLNGMAISDPRCLYAIVFSSFLQWPLMFLWQSCRFSSFSIPVIGSRGFKLELIGFCISYQVSNIRTKWSSTIFSIIYVLISGSDGCIIWLPYLLKSISSGDHDVLSMTPYIEKDASFETDYYLCFEALLTSSAAMI